jgi:hypothetical protein
MITIHHVFKHPWAIITHASWKKYPNPRRPDILNVELISKTIKSNQLTIQRLITIKYQFPSWVPHGISNTPMYCLETTTINSDNQTMESHSYNLSFQNFIDLNETCLYTSLTPNTTNLTQTVSIKAHVTLFSYHFEKWFLDTYLNKVDLGRQIMEDTIVNI